jgi:hypothetical protein
VIRILLIATIVLFLVLWVRATMDAWRRGDLNTGQKSAWTIIMLIFPFVGLLVYTMLRPGDSQIEQRSRR